MIILTRRPGEGFMIGDDIYIRISLTGRKRYPRTPPRTVSLAIDAPREVNIVREELIERDRGKEDSRKDSPRNRQDS